MERERKERSEQIMHFFHANSWYPSKRKTNRDTLVCFLFCLRCLVGSCTLKNEKMLNNCFIWNFYYSNRHFRASSSSWVEKVVFFTRNLITYHHVLKHVLIIYEHDSRDHRHKIEYYMVHCLIDHRHPQALFIEDEIYLHVSKFNIWKK